MSSSPVRTAKAERRMLDRQQQEGGGDLDNGGGDGDASEMALSAADEREVRAEKKAAWRKARYDRHVSYHQLDRYFRVFNKYFNSV